MNVWKIEPAIDPRHHLPNRKWLCHDPAVRRQADEAEQSGPGEPDTFGARQALVPPPTGARVDCRIGVMRMNENVDVGQNHVWSPGSPRSLPLPARRRAD